MPLLFGAVMFIVVAAILGALIPGNKDGGGADGPDENDDTCFT